MQKHSIWEKTFRAETLDMRLWQAYQWRIDCKTCFYSKQYVALQDVTGLLSERIPKVMTSRRKRLWDRILANLMGSCNTEVYTKKCNRYDIAFLHEGGAHIPVYLTSKI